MNSRHITSYVPTRDEGTKRELYFSYVAGWRDAAGTRSLDPKFSEHPTRPDIKAAYLEGFTDGKKANRAAREAAARVYNYKPTILRAT
jgi:hypothetical protein